MYAPPSSVVYQLADLVEIDPFDIIPLDICSRIHVALVKQEFWMMLKELTMNFHPAMP